MNHPGQIWDALERVRCLEFVLKECARAGLTFELLWSDRKFRIITDTRQRIWVMMRHTNGWSYPFIAHLFGVDHSSIMHAVKRRERQLEKEHAP